MTLEYLMHGLMAQPNREDWRLKFYNVYAEVADQFYKKYFKHWETDRLKVRLWDDDKKMSAVVQFNRLLFLLEKSEVTEEFRNMSEQFVVSFCNTMEITKLMKLGVTRTAIVPMKETYEALVKRLQPKFYPSNSEIDKIIGKEYADVAFISEFIRFGFHCNVNIGPVKKQEIIEKLSSRSFYIKEKESHLPEVAIWIDLRMEQHNAMKEGFESSIKTAWDKSHETIVGLANFLCA